MKLDESPVKELQKREFEEKGTCPWEQQGTVLAIEIPGDFNRRMPCEHAFVLKVPQL